MAEPEDTIVDECERHNQAVLLIARIVLEKTLTRYNGDLATFRANGPVFLPALASLTLATLTAALGGNGWAVLAMLLGTFTALLYVLLFEQRLTDPECIYRAPSIAALAASFHPSEHAYSIEAVRDHESELWKVLCRCDAADSDLHMAEVPERAKRMVVRGIARLWGVKSQQ